MERAYRLCRYCEASLHQTLGKQDSWLKPKLLSWKLEKNRQSPLSTGSVTNEMLLFDFCFRIDPSYVGLAKWKYFLYALKLRRYKKDADGRINKLASGNDVTELSAP